jgi:hypothetical protein
MPPLLGIGGIKFYPSLYICLSSICFPINNLSSLVQIIWNLYTDELNLINYNLLAVFRYVFLLLVKYSQKIPK